MKRDTLLNLIGRFIVVLAGYGGLLLLYFLLVLRPLERPLTRLCHGNLRLYILLGLGLIIAQSVVLGMITSFLVEQLRPEQLE